MNTIYITDTGRVMLDENNNPSPLYCTRNGIDDVFYLKQDVKIIYEKGDKKSVLNAKAGNIVLIFYEKTFPNRVIVVDSNEWKENIEVYEAKEQEIKEKWAGKNLAECGQCPDCAECAESPSC